MDISAARLSPQPLPDLSNVEAPKFDYSKSFHAPASAFTVYYRDTELGDRTQKTLSERDINRRDYAQVTGSFDQALKAAQLFSEWKDEAPDLGFLTSTAIYQAGDGVYNLVRSSYYDSPDDEMSATISLPIDAVTTHDVDNSIHYWGNATPSVAVAFKNDDLLALVGRDVWVSRG